MRDFDEMLEQRGEFVLSTAPERLDREQIYRFLSEQSYWAAGVPRATVDRALDHSLCVGVYQIGLQAPLQSPPQRSVQSSGQLAFARAVTDCATFAYVADVFVVPAARGQGFAKWMIAALSRHPQLQGLRRWLLATRDAHGLYAQFGFKPLANPTRVMERHDPDVYSRAPSR